MESLRRRRPGYATVVAYLALFVALGGSSYAAVRVGSAQIADNSVRSKDLRNNDIRGRDVRNNALTGADISEARMGTVPRASTANSAETAATAGNAATLGGIGAGGYVRSATEATRLVGAPGDPAFQGGFGNLGLGEPAGFYKDQLGIVHLQGDLDPPGSSGTIFILPPGYRPIHGGASGPQFAVRADASVGVVEVRFDGHVRALESYANHMSLNGLTFRAEQ